MAAWRTSNWWEEMSTWISRTINSDVVAGWGQWHHCSQKSIKLTRIAHFNESHTVLSVSGSACQTAPRGKHQQSLQSVWCGINMHCQWQLIVFNATNANQIALIFCTVEGHLWRVGVNEWLQCLHNALPANAVEVSHFRLSTITLLYLNWTISTVQHKASNDATLPFTIQLWITRKYASPTAFMEGLKRLDVHPLHSTWSTCIRRRTLVSTARELKWWRKAGEYFTPNIYAMPQHSSLAT